VDAIEEVKTCALQNDQGLLRIILGLLRLRTVLFMYYSNRGELCHHYSLRFSLRLRLRLCFAYVGGTGSTQWTLKSSILGTTYLEHCNAHG
jgi:hypothetical protein